MIVSENEILVTVRKAAEATGLDPGRSTDLASAVAWLASVGLNGVPAAVRALSNRHEASADTTNAVLEGTKCCDLALSLHHNGLRNLGRVDEPLLLLGIAVIAASGGRSLGIEWIDGHERAAAYCIDGTALIAAESPDILDARAVPTGIGRAPLADLHAPFELRPDDIQTRSRKSREEGITVDDKDWATLKRLAAETRLPASETSRLKNAGAGIIETD